MPPRVVCPDLPEATARHWCLVQRGGAAAAAASGGGGGGVHQRRSRILDSTTTVVPAAAAASRSGGVRRSTASCLGVSAGMSCSKQHQCHQGHMRVYVCNRFVCRCRPASYLTVAPAQSTVPYRYGTDVVLDTQADTKTKPDLLMYDSMRCASTPHACIDAHACTGGAHRGWVCACGELNR